MIAKTKGIEDIRKLTKVLPTVRYVDPEYVYLSVTNARCATAEVYVQPGDKVKIGTVIGKRFGGYFEQNIHSTVSGEIVDIHAKKFHRSGKRIDFIKIKNDMQNTYDESCKERTNEEIAKLTKDEITEIVKNCSVVGLGGSSFPTYIKFQTKDPIKYILLNGIECEPYLSADHRLMIEEPDKLINGIELILNTFKAEKAYICIKQKYQDLYDVLTDTLKKFNLPIEVSRVGNFYPQGWEIAMIKSCLGIDIPSGVLPAKFGIMNFNVTTAVAIYDAVKYNLPVIERNFTVTGDGIKYAKNFRVRCGTPIQELIAECGGYVDEEQDKVFIMGGPMMGSSLVMDDAIVTKTTTSVIILNKWEDVEEPCVRCASCVYSCPVGLQPVNIMNAYKAGDVDAIKGFGIKKCIECGLCSYSCTSKIPVTEYMRKAKKLAK